MGFKPLLPHSPEWERKVNGLYIKIIVKEMNVNSKIKKYIYSIDEMVLNLLHVLTSRNTHHGLPEKKSK